MTPKQDPDALAAEAERAAEQLGIAVPAGMVHLGNGQALMVGTAADFWACARILAYLERGERLPAQPPEPEPDTRPLAERLAWYDDPANRPEIPIWNMGIKLITEIMDHAPEMTAAQWRALVILAEDANDGTRLTWSSVQSKKIMDRIGLPKGQWANLRTALVRKKLLEIAEPGVKGRTAKYRFPEYSKMLHKSYEESAAEPAAEPAMPHESCEASEPMPHESDEASAECFIGSVTPTPLVVPPLKNTPLSPPAATVITPTAVVKSDEREMIDPIQEKIMNDHGATAAEAAALVAAVRREGRIRSVTAWVKTCGDDVANRLAEQRKIAATLAAAREASAAARPVTVQCEQCPAEVTIRPGDRPLCFECRFPPETPEQAAERKAAQAASDAARDAAMDGVRTLLAANKGKGAATGSSSPPERPPSAVFDHDGDKRRKDARKQRGTVAMDEATRDKVMRELHPEQYPAESFAMVPKSPAATDTEQEA